MTTKFNDQQYFQLHSTTLLKLIAAMVSRPYSHELEYPVSTPGIVGLEEECKELSYSQQCVLGGGPLDQYSNQHGYKTATQIND